MVDVSAAVESDCVLKGNLAGDVVGGCGCGVGFESVVEVSYVCLVVFAVVEFHDLGGYAGLQCLYGIRDIRGIFGVLMGMRDVHRMHRAAWGGCRFRQTC